MRGKKKIKKRQLANDPHFTSPLVSKLVTKIMRNGKKSQAQGIVYQAFAHLKAKGEDPLEAFEKAVKELKPELETEKIRLGGASQLIPKKVKSERGICLAQRWLVESARKKKGPISLNLAEEIIAVLKKQGEAFKKKEEEQKKAVSSMAFASLNLYARRK